MNQEDKEMPTDSTIQEYTNKDLEKGKRIIIILAASILLLCACNGILIFTKKDMLVLSSPAIYESDLFEDVCFNAFHSITRKDAQPAFVHDNFRASLIESNYQDIDLRPSKDDYRMVKKINQGKCKIVVRSKTSNGRDLRAFVATTLKQPSSPFEYKVLSVSEILLTDQDRRLK